MAAAKEEGILAPVKSGTGGAANPVADLVTRDGAEHDGKQEPLERNDAGERKDTGGDEKRIAGEKKPNKESGFNEDDGANERSASGAD